MLCNLIIKQRRCLLERGARLSALLLPWAFLMMTEAHLLAQGTDQFDYIVSDGTVMIMRYHCSESVVNIPGTINGLPVTRIGQSSFSECMRLTSVTIPDSVTLIDGGPTGSGAFWGCTNLSSVTMGANVRTISYFAFTDCVRLTNFVIPASVMFILDFAFAGCTGLTGFQVDPLNTRFSTMDGVLFNKNQSTLVQYPPGKAGPYTIPDGVTNIGSHAFYAIPNLTRVTVPSSVSVIKPGWFPQDGAFAYSNLEGLYFKGNAPTTTSVFGPDETVLVYYLPGKTGWAERFMERPTRVWEPRMRTDATRFGVGTNPFGFIIEWAAKQAVIVEASTDLVHPDWLPVATNILASDSFHFSERQGNERTARFYRLRSP